MDFPSKSSEPSGNLNGGRVSINEALFSLFEVKEQHFKHYRQMSPKEETHLPRDVVLSRDFGLLAQLPLHAYC